MFEIETSLIDFKKSQEFKSWLDKQSLTIDSIQKSLNQYLWNHIADNIDDKIKKYSIKNIKPKYEMGYVVPDILKENFKIQKIEKIIPVENFATLELSTTLSFDGKLFFPNYEKGDFSNYESLQFIALITLVLSYDKDLVFEPISIAVNKIEVE